jgi:hypothetical protein
MTPLGEIANRWSNSHPTPIFVGAVPEGTPPPHLALTENTTSQVRASGNVISWNQTAVTITAVASTSVEAGELGDYMEMLFNGVSFGSVADMVMTMRSVSYMDTPTLTGNRGWVAMLDFSIKY